jgi:predicted nucleic acid-binding protein
MIVFDSNVLSEFMRPNPAERVRRWQSEQEQTRLFTTSITVAEIWFGIQRLPDGQRKERFAEAANDLFSSFADRILAFDRRAAEVYARIATQRAELGLPIDGFDAQIAAVCAVHGATLATRNIKDFEETGISLVNPWFDS